MTDIESISNSPITCAICPAREQCLVYAADPKQRLVDGQQRQHFPVYSAGRHIYWKDDPLQDLYIVRTGCIKTYAVDVEGNERIRGFHLPGDILALDALQAGKYQSNACAITEATICAVHHQHLIELEASHPDFCQRLLARISADLSEALIWAGEFTAEERLSAFLLHLNQREQRQGLVNEHQINLMISRRDIANYLRLAPETVSRCLTRFEKRGLIRCSARELQILDRAALHSIAQPVGIVATPDPARLAA